ncbi:hypothetical protein VNO77_22862 [Canavalia gladiata]|uniref:Uncharacterized protein n=1 Tax=Canavalia gladiata TaxID=3824 RepID=A0AAN9QEV7_CANGL
MEAVEPLSLVSKSGLEFLLEKYKSYSVEDCMGTTRPCLLIPFFDHDKRGGSGPCLLSPWSVNSSKANASSHLPFCEHEGSSALAMNLGPVIWASHTKKPCPLSYKLGQ